MKMTEIKALSKADALAKVSELKKELFDSSQKMRQGELKNYNLIKQARRTIARILTAVNSGKLSEAAVAVAEKPVKAEKTKKVKEVKEK